MKANGRRGLIARALLVAVSGLLVSHLANAVSDQSVDDLLRQQIKQQRLDVDPLRGLHIPATDDSLFSLGKQLFFSKSLSGRRDTSCATCHHPVLGGGDGLTLPVGSESANPDIIGPGREHSKTGTEHDGGPTVPRNSPTTFNIALWQQVIFHDGRVQSVAGGISTPTSAPQRPDPGAGDDLVATQALLPVTSEAEMRGHRFAVNMNHTGVRRELTERLKYSDSQNGTSWLELFRQAFEAPTASADELIVYPNVAAALSAYQRSQVFVDSPWQQYVAGDNTAISEQAKQGAKLFMTSTQSGGAGCISCHSGSKFTDEDFHMLLMPQVGRGKGRFNGRTRSDDLGRYMKTGKWVDKWKFRTPSLLNVEVTGPWSHAGAYLSLADVIRHHFDPVAAVREFDINSLDPAVQTTDTRANAEIAIKHFNAVYEKKPWPLADARIDDDAIDKLVAFLKTLTDGCVKDRQCLAKWLPGEREPDPDGNRLSALDENGNPL